MKPPEHATVVATPVANCWLEGDVLCVDNLNCRRTVHNAAVHYKIVESLIGSRKVPILKEFPYCELFSAEARELAVRRLAPHCRALAIITLPSGVEALAASFSHLSQAGVPVKVFVKEVEA